MVTENLSPSISPYFNSPRHRGGSSREEQGPPILTLFPYSPCPHFPRCRGGSSEEEQGASCSQGQRCSGNAAQDQKGKKGRGGSREPGGKTCTGHSRGGRRGRGGGGGGCTPFRARPQEAEEDNCCCFDPTASSAPPCPGEGPEPCRRPHSVGDWGEQETTAPRKRAAAPAAGITGAGIFCQRRGGGGGGGPPSSGCFGAAGSEPESPSRSKTRGRRCSDAFPS